MNDGSGFTDEGAEPLEIDVRSPGERWADSGREGFGRLHDTIRAQPFGTAAVLWMAALVVIVASQAYTQWNVFGDSGFGNDIWIKLALLAQGASYALSAAAMIGLGLAFLSGTAQAKTAYVLGVAIGAWTAVIGLGGVASAMRGYGEVNLFRANRVVFGLESFASGALGMIVLLIAWGLLAQPPAELD